MTNYNRAPTTVDVLSKQNALRGELIAKIDGMKVELLLRLSLIVAQLQRIEEALEIPTTKRTPIPIGRGVKAPEVPYEPSKEEIEARYSTKSKTTRHRALGSPSSMCCLKCPQ